MLKPKRMARILLTGSRDDVDDVVEILHDANAVHLIRHEPEDEDDVQIGDPMERNERLSEHLVVLRSAKSALDIDEADARGETFTVQAIEDELEQRIFDLKTNIESIREDREEIHDVLGDLETDIEALEPFADFPLTLDQYRGYDSLVVLTGRLDDDPEPILSELDVDGGAFSADDVHAVFVPDDDEQAVRDALNARGWTPIEAPEGEGDVQEKLHELRQERDRFERKLDDLDERRERLSEEHAAFVVAAEEHLTIEVEKAEAPMEFAQTDNAFVLEGWVPADELAGVQARLESEVGSGVHVETAEVAKRQIDHHDDHGHDDHEEDGDEPPTELENEGASQPFEFVTKLMSRPSYEEIDPTSLLVLFFPLLFGLMIGDVGYGIAIVALGYFLFDNDIFGIGGEHIGKVLIACGISTIAFGGIVFQEMFGLHFLYPPAEVKHIEHVIHEGHAHFSHGQLVVEGEFIPPTWAGMFLGAEEALEISKGISYGPSFLKMPLVKLNALPELMQISIWLALIHMTLGFALGFVNEKDHLGVGKALAGQIGWTLVMWGLFFAIVIGMLGAALEFTYIPVDWFPAVLSLSGVEPHSFSLGIVLTGLGAVGLMVAEPEALVELFGVLANMISYARLAAIGISKAGFIFVFNVIAFQTLDGGIFGILILAVAHAIVFAVGLLSSGVQTLRLNFYEFFSKFYEGGGHPYNPFGQKRERTEA